MSGRLDLLDGEEGDQLKRNMEHLRKAVDDAIKLYSAKAPKLFSSASTYALREVGSKKTSQCCKGKSWGYRDSDFDSWLPANQPNRDAGSVTVLAFEKDWTFAEAAVSVLNVSPDTSVITLGKLLKERRYTMTLAQAEFMAEATECGENTGMVTNGWGNFFFVENEDESVSVAGVSRGGGGRPWGADVLELAFSGRWYADYRLILCNLDPSKLEL